METDARTVQGLYRDAEGEYVSIAAYDGNWSEWRTTEVQIRTWEMHRTSEYRDRCALGVQGRHRRAERKSLKTK